MIVISSKNIGKIFFRISHSSGLCYAFIIHKKTKIMDLGKTTGHSDFPSLFTLMHWRRKWQPTSVFLPGESQGLGEPGGLPSMGSHRVGHD